MKLHRTNEFYKDVFKNSVRTFIIYLFLTTIIYVISGDGTFLERVWQANSTAFSFLWLVILMCYLIVNRQYKRAFNRSLNRNNFFTFDGNVVNKTETTNAKKAGLFLAVDFHQFENLYKYINVIKSCGKKGVWVLSGEKSYFEENVNAGTLAEIISVLDKNKVLYRLEFGFEFDEWELIII